MVLGVIAFLLAKAKICSKVLGTTQEDSIYVEQLFAITALTAVSVGMIFVRCLNKARHTFLDNARTENYVPFRGVFQAWHGSLKALAESAILVLIMVTVLFQSGPRNAFTLSFMTMLVYVMINLRIAQKGNSLDLND